MNSLNQPFKSEDVDISRGRLPAVPYHMVAIEPGRNRDSIMVNDNFGPERDREHSFETIYQATKLPREVIAIPQWGDQVAKMFQEVNEKTGGKPVDPRSKRCLGEQFMNTHLNISTPSKRCIKLAPPSHFQSS